MVTLTDSEDAEALACPRHTRFSHFIGYMAVFSVSVLVIACWAYAF